MAAPNAPQDSTDRITKENRHQFFETAIASVSEADQQIRQAEARGRERRVREDELRQKLRRMAIGAAIVGALAVAAGLVVWLVK